MAVFPGGDKLFRLHRPLGHGRGFFSRQRNRFRIPICSVASTDEWLEFHSGQIHFHGSPSLGRGELPFGKPSSSPTVSSDPIWRFGYSAGFGYPDLLGGLAEV